MSSAGGPPRSLGTKLARGYLHCTKEVSLCLVDSIAVYHTNNDKYSFHCDLLI